MTSRAWTLVALSLAIAPRAVAQDPKEVLAEFKQQTKLAVKECKSSLAELADALQTEIDIFVLGFEQLAVDDGPVDDFAEALISYQKAAHLIVDDATQAIGSASGAALAQLTPAGPDESVLPLGLLVGDGGTLDDARAQLVQAAAKANASAVKKLVKLAKKLRAKTDMRLSLVLPPQPVRLTSPVSGGFASAQPNTLVIDLVLGFNRGGADDDGRLWISGFAESGDVALSTNGPTSVSDSVTPAVFDGRWSWATDVATDPLEEGNYLVLAQQGSGAFTTRTIGLP
jgi:hypothetical protein